MLDIRPQDLAIVRAALAASLPADALVWVFGSRARRTARAASDLDLAIDAGRPLTLDDRGRLAEAFEESDLAYRVDVVDLTTIAAAFRQTIEAYAVALEPARTRSD